MIMMVMMVMNMIMALMTIISIMPSRTMIMRSISKMSNKDLKRELIGKRILVHQVTMIMLTMKIMMMMSKATWR